MAKVVIGVYMVRYPLGGMLSWALQYILGLQRAGHDVLIVEKGAYPDSCFDPISRTMTDDPRTGLKIVRALLEQHGLGDRLSFVDLHGNYFGIGKQEVERSFRDADLFIDCGTHGQWLQEVSGHCPTALIDGEPGYTQIRWLEMEARGRPPTRYDYYFSNGMLLGTEHSAAPTAGREWSHVFNPVLPEIFATDKLPPPDAPFSTVMNWKSHDAVTYRGISYGQKDCEFERFLDLPARTNHPVAIAVAGNPPRGQLLDSGWQLFEAHKVTTSFSAYRAFIHQSAGEFSVAKQVFVALRTGWFSDRSASYLAAGRPVVLQNTGFDRVLPTGEGLFAVQTVDEAAAAIDAIKSDYGRHSRAALEIAREHLDATIVMQRLLERTIGG